MKILVTYIVKEFSSRAILKHHEDLGVCLHHLVQLAHMLMGQLLHCLNFKVNARQILLERRTNWSLVFSVQTTSFEEERRQK